MDTCCALRDKPLVEYDGGKSNIKRRDVVYFFIFHFKIHARLHTSLIGSLACHLDCSHNTSNATTMATTKDGRRKLALACRLARKFTLAESTSNKCMVPVATAATTYSLHTCSKTLFQPESFHSNQESFQTESGFSVLSLLLH